MMAKNDEIRQNIIPLSKQYMTIEAAQADIANIPEGSTTYVRSSDDAYLAIEYKNTGGVLQPTGRTMISGKTAVRRTDEYSDGVTYARGKVMSSGELLPGTLQEWTDCQHLKTSQHTQPKASQSMTLIRPTFLSVTRLSKMGLFCWRSISQAALATFRRSIVAPGNR